MSALPREPEVSFVAEALLDERTVADVIDRLGRLPTTCESTLAYGRVVQALRELSDGLRASLERYGRHEGGCPAGNEASYSKRCSCGLHVALARAAALGEKERPHRGD